ncbi:MAG: putative toxin-antitoxin system toxin component, PIN family [Acidobacteria bacterium]|nr:putative toxin-antitoxin system toxin component, PIN family [Acidobacteriota bacterium]
MGVVDDTNVYVSALTFGGVADEVLILGRRGTISLFISPPILEEIEGDLTKTKFRWSAPEIRAAISSIQQYVCLVRPREVVAHLNGNDPDNRVLECAVEAGALFRVTGDHHLRNLRTFRGITIVNPREFLDARLWT